MLNSVHDVFIALIDSAFAFEMPRMAAGWIDTVDVETGRSCMVSRSSLRQLSNRVRQWQDHVEQTAKGCDLDVLRIEPDHARTDVALAQFVAERRLRKQT